jgi:phosphopantothenate-cysteine ligase/phosphopantothenoylcysteine decarboxylase/phosphopantothenate--cysteine ligase
MKKILITAGSTITPIDKVRTIIERVTIIKEGFIANPFKGGTGIKIAQYFAKQGCEVALILSKSALVNKTDIAQINKIIKYETFEDLERIMKQEITTGNYDIVIHSSAVSDYQVENTFIEVEGKMIKIDASTKIDSSHAKIYLEMMPTKKLVDLIRRPWGFAGTLVKFKLQVGISDEELIDIAQKSRKHSEADVIVANCLEWFTEYAYILTENGQKKVTRKNLAQDLFREINDIRGE